MSILLHWQNKMSPSNKGQGARGNWQKVTHNETLTREQNL